MTFYVPDWDDTSHSLKVFDDASLHHIGKGGAHPHPHQHQFHHSLQKKSCAALVPNNDVSESLTQLGMQGGVGSQIIGEVERASVPAFDIPLVMSNPCVHEDEMLSWLRYPLEDSFDRNYCSEIFGELVNPHVHLVKDTFLHQTLRETENTHELTIEGSGREQTGSQQLVNASSMHYARPGVKSDAAMAMGAGRAAGLVFQTGSEAFTGVRTHVHPSSLLKPLSSSVTEPSLDGKKPFETYDPIMSLLDVKKTSVLSPTTPMSSGFNFSLFSRPVATTLDSLRIVGAASAPTNVERARQPLAKDLPCEPSVGDSNGRVMMSMQLPSQQSTQQSTGFSSQGKIVGDGGGYALAGWSLPTNLPCRPDVLPRRPDVRMLNETAELNSHVTCFSGSAITGSENALGMTEAAETTVSASRLSGSSTEETAEEAFTSTPKKKSSAEYTEDVEDVTANAKKPPPGPRAMKRSRAAETHNESEKKRRNKINVRLKALQSLIPNSNKTDKASVLDEAIEYTKMLQAQVQFMSMRTGMFVPQMMMPSGMHYVPVHQMPLSHMGMGMGMGFGMGSDMGMCATDINAATAGLGIAARVTGAGAGAGAGSVLNSSPTSSQSPSRQTNAGARLQQTSSAPLSHDVSLYLPTSCTSEPYKMMLAQQPLQPMPVNVQMNPDMYNALVQQRQPQENHISNVIR